MKIVVFLTSAIAIMAASLPAQAKPYTLRMHSTQTRSPASITYPTVRYPTHRRPQYQPYAQPASSVPASRSPVRSNQQPTITFPPVIIHQPSESRSRQHRFRSRSVHPRQTQSGNSLTIIFSATRFNPSQSRHYRD